MEFARGAIQNRNIEEENGVATSPITIIGDTTRSGTEVHFLADETVFGNVEFHYEILVKRIRELSFLNNGVHIKLIDQRSGQEEDFAFSGGVKGFGSSPCSLIGIWVGSGDFNALTFTIASS